MKILFVCGRNKQRSPTAERIYANDPRVKVRSVGVGKTSTRRLREKDISWADIIIVMEGKYKKRIVEASRSTYSSIIENLDIPDDYDFMDPELISLIKDGTEYFIDLYASEIVSEQVAGGDATR
ncbi:MAG: hypothetical protein AB3N10_09500 [Allomuricauda sp.]